MANGNYGGIINNFMGELSQPPGDTVYDRFGIRILVTHLPCCSHLAHLLTLTFRMFNWIHYKELSGAENRFVNSFVWGLQQHTSKTACSWNQSDTVGVSVSNVFEFFFLRLFHTRSINMTKPKKQLKRGFFRLFCVYFKMSEYVLSGFTCSKQLVLFLLFFSCFNTVNPSL